MSKLPNEMPLLDVYCKPLLALLTSSLSTHVKVLADVDSPNYVLPLAPMIAGVVRPLPHLLNAFRNGGGVAYSEFGTILPFANEMATTFYQHLFTLDPSLRAMFENDLDSQ